MDSDPAYTGTLLILLIIRIWWGHILDGVFCSVYILSGKWYEGEKNIITDYAA